MSRAERVRRARRRAHRAGQVAEWAAIATLRLKGYRILARRFVVKGGEIDIVAARGRTIAFVEVKLRATIDEALVAIDPVKRRRIARAARVFVSRHAIIGRTLRGDAVSCAAWRWPRHVADAFELRLD